MHGQFADADLVLAADGVNSQLRQQFTDEFGTTIDYARNRYIWLGTTKVFTAFTYAFERTEAGWIWFHAYPFDTSTTTFIAECGPSTWEGLGFEPLARRRAGQSWSAFSCATWMGTHYCCIRRSRAPRHG